LFKLEECGRLFVEDIFKKKLKCTGALNCKSKNLSYIYILKKINPIVSKCVLKMLKKVEKKIIH